MFKDTISKIILENQNLIFSKKLIQRNYHIPQTEHITVLTGIRRAGKTHILYSIAQQYKKEDILFLDFEDERLLELNLRTNYDVILDSYQQIYPDKKPIIFFDEIQNLKNWHFYLKRLHVHGYKIFVTGSNAHLISSEIATYLKGRSLETQIYPFSFEEYLKLKNLSYTKKEQFTKIPEILNHFDSYLYFGGFPEVIKAPKNDKRTVASNIFDLLFYKDLIAKYDKNPYLLKLIINKISENITKEFSVSSIYKSIKNIFETSRPTVNDYFSVLPEAFLIDNLFAYKTSFIQRQSKRKTYLADNSFIFLNRISTDKSRLFENLVYNYLQRKYRKLYYYKTKNAKEIDFLINTSSEIKLIQVCYSLENPTTKKREIENLLTAMNELNIKQATIYTYNENETIAINDKKIEIKAFWKNCLYGVIY